nr:hypothetical protein [Micromonospora mirobrigensis]
MVDPIPGAASRVPASLPHHAPPAQGSGAHPPAHAEESRNTGQPISVRQSAATSVSRNGLIARLVIEP